MTNIEKELDRKFQQLAVGCDCEVCRAIKRIGPNPAYYNNPPGYYGEGADEHFVPDPSDSDGRAACNHHIIHRANRALRWDWRNGLAVCQHCHDRIHFEGNFGKWVEEFVIGRQKMYFLQMLALTKINNRIEWESLRSAELNDQIDESIRYRCESLDLPF